MRDKIKNKQYFDEFIAEDYARILNLSKKLKKEKYKKQELSL